MKRINVIIVTLLMAVMLIPALPANAVPMREKEDIRELARDIQSINLINGLYLSREQMSKLAALAEEAQKLDREMKMTQDGKYREVKKVLTEMRTQLMSSMDISGDLKRRYHRATYELKKAKADYEDGMKSLTDRAHSVLNENQKIMLTEYQPCLVPQRDTVNPERIGQSGGNKRITKMLERIRRVPDSHYPRVKNKILGRVREKIRIHIHREEDRKEIVKKLGDAMDQARSLSDEEFEIKKSEIAANARKHKKNRGGRRTGRKKTEMFVRRFLLNPNNVAILRYKMSVATK